jgi:ergothioneine biosynthesis protein EgtB
LRQPLPENLHARYRAIRNQTLRLVGPLQKEDFVVQPIVDVSPPKWHLAHTTWFFETFVLVSNATDYNLFDKSFPYLFNSYYISAGDRWSRADRGNLTRPSVDEVFAYREYVDEAMEKLILEADLTSEQLHVIEVGFHHEQQHQELLLYDIKYIFGHNPTFPVYKGDSENEDKLPVIAIKWLPIKKGNYHIGHEGDFFCFDNELRRHEVHLEGFEIANRLVTNGEYLDFMKSGGYSDHSFWLSDGWDWIQSNKLECPLYWFEEDGEWKMFGLSGLKKLNINEPVAHVSYYEADAYAKWAGLRLPTEFEWEMAAMEYGTESLSSGNFVDDHLMRPKAGESLDFFGNLWEWTASAYLPYPYYQAPPGALGEYNGKFMINQMVLRGGSYATPQSHIRPTYRNFFQPNMRWLFNGIRLARFI